MSKEAMKLAVRSLKELVPDDSDHSPAIQGQRKRQEKAIKALQEALAEQPAQQCKWPTCQSEEAQQALAEQLKRELVGKQPAQQEPWPEEPIGHMAGGVQLSGTRKSKAITELYALFDAPHNADINLTGLNRLLDELTEFSPAQRTWVDPNDKTQKQYLPHIGEPVLFCHKGAAYMGKHTGGSFQSESTNQYFNTWECHWMYLPTAHNIKENT